MNTKIYQPFITQFTGDESYDPTPRQTPEVFYTLVHPQHFSSPTLLHYNDELGEKLGFSEMPEKLLTAQEYPDELKPYATAYAGHQFGHWAGQLGDGRAILLGEVYNEQKSYELQWKGAGLTPYSRRADGKAVLRSSIREYLMSEAMYHLNIPTTRALSLALTGEDIIRDMFYDGHPQAEKGAVVMRVSESFIRFGHFELLASRQDKQGLKQLADYVISKYEPDLMEIEEPERYTKWFEKIVKKTIEMIIGWYRVGFVHGVMNTDNMSILGNTIDYGPFSMLDAYDDNFTPNTTDLPARRYAFGKQSKIAEWNLYKLASALLPINGDISGFQKILDNYDYLFQQSYQTMMANKLGLDHFRQEDDELINQLHHLLQETQMDYTLFFHCLENINEEHDLNKQFSSASYNGFSIEQKNHLSDFIKKYKKRLELNDISQEGRLAKMHANNPRFILRNYLLHECIQEVEKGNMTLFKRIWNALQTPYKLVDIELMKRSPIWAKETPGCSTLSCSS